MNLDKLTTDLEYIKELREWFKSVTISPSQGLNSDGVPFKEGKDTAHLISRIKSAILATGDKIIAEQQNLVRETITNEVLGEEATKALKEISQSGTQGAGIALDEDGQREGEHPEPIDEMQNELKHSAPEHESSYINDKIICNIIKNHFDLTNDRPWPCYPQIMEEQLFSLLPPDKTKCLSKIADRLYTEFVKPENKFAFHNNFARLFQGREAAAVTVYDVSKLVKEYS